MDATPFRTITTPAPTPSVEQNGGQETAPKRAAIEQSSEIRPSLTAYSEIEGVPYTADHFDIRPFMQDASYSEMQNDVYAVDSWVRSQIADKGLTDTPEAYAEIVATLDAEIGVYKTEKPLEHFRRIAAAVKALERLSAARIKPVLDMKSLTTSEYEQIVGAYRG